MHPTLFTDSLTAPPENIYLANVTTSRYIHTNIFSKIITSRYIHTNLYITITASRYSASKSQPHDTQGVGKPNTNTSQFWSNKQICGNVLAKVAKFWSNISQYELNLPFSPRLYRWPKQGGPTVKSPTSPKYSVGNIFRTPALYSDNIYLTATTS